MVARQASTADDYVAQLPEDRRAVVSAVRRMVLEHLPAGYVESTGWGMITYGVPLERFPDTYNGQPLCTAGLAAQKHHVALYLMGAYAEPAIEAALRDGFARAGKKLDMGKSCVRFKRLEDVDLAVLGRAIAAMPPERLMAHHDAVHGKGGARRSALGGSADGPQARAKRATAKKTAARKRG